MEYYTKQLKEDFYRIPKEKKRGVLLEPYMDTEVNIMMTSAVVPIMLNGKFLGVAGVDMALGALSEMVAKITPYETGIASIFSPSGIYIAHPDSAKVNKEVESSVSSAKEYKESLSKGEQFSIIGFSDGLEEDSYRIFMPIKLENGDVNSFFSVEVSLSKVLENGKKILWVCLITGSVAVVAAAFVIFLIALSITRPINQTVAGLRDIAEGEGDLTMRLSLKSKDELGDLASWFNVFMEKMQNIIRQVSENTNEVDKASQDLSGIATDLSSHAENTSERANSVAAATQEFNANVSTIAAAMEESTTNTSMVGSASEEMSATIGQISENVQEASQISGSAVQQAEITARQMEELEQAASAISRITEVITDISEKTNLLALNATIEAARAGEAGKGFAVVANEIKDLAQQTAEATSDIKDQVEGIQGTSQTSITAIGDIVSIINQVNEIITDITTAVSEQSTVAQEITSNITQASQGLMEINENVNQSASISGEISQDISLVSDAAGQIAGTSTDLTSQASDLQELSTKLKDIVNSFKI